MESPLDDTPTADGTVTGTVKPRDSGTSASGSEVGANGAVVDDEALGDDLFGDEADEDDIPKKQRRLDDEELDSGDDVGRDDRMRDEDDEARYREQKESHIVELDLARTVKPEPSDGEMYLLKLPSFLEIDPKAFTLESFKPPNTDHRSKTTPSATFSAYSTAMTTIRWRRSPSAPSETQSNARILRWSDGSLTLQLASDPMIQYELPANPLAPPQANPRKPTPNMLPPKSKSRATHSGYDAAKDAWTYLATPHHDYALHRFTHKLTTGLSVTPTAGAAAADDALERLQESMAAVQRQKDELVAAGQFEHDIHEDPELAKKRAEQAEKEKIRAQRRAETQANRERERYGRVVGRSGGRGAGGLTVGGLEDHEDGAGGKRYAGGRPTKPKKKRRLRDEYSDEDDYAGRRRTKEDEYDEEDDFIAGSDEEIVEEDSEEDVDERIEAQEREKARARPRERSATPKRRAVEVSGGDDDEEEEGASQSLASPKAAKRRRVIDDDDEE
ncbi:hypothetical protein NA57DRAFT_61889 [Rhizodiscina lignyota]|uniref:Leo1-domain-containing protein n=1 Tax=Rhizodiscina lignyota TaxID=1504668 RepID=A0A9P4I5Y6_9PEZI|nr:hypothetical protein NA57DRAFT_61889 [Rhizodiscina lignyota]